MYLWFRREKCYVAHCSKSSSFVQNFNFDIPWNLSIFWVKNSWKWCGLGLFSCWQLWFHEKNCQKKIWVKNSWKCWGFVKIEFLDKNLTFRIVWISRISRIRDKFFMMFRLSCCSQNQDGLRLIRISYGAVLSVSSKKPLQVWSWMIYWFSLKLLINYFWLE